MSNLIFARPFRSRLLSVATMAERSAIRRLRTIASATLCGAVTAGVFFGWAGGIGGFGVHEIGAVVGAGLGAIGTAKNLI